jgi:hypothetical protein
MKPLAALSTTRNWQTPISAMESRQDSSGVTTRFFGVNERPMKILAGQRARGAGGGPTLVTGAGAGRSADECSVPGRAKPTLRAPPPP